MQSLIQILKSGYGYDRTKEDGTREHVLVAPNKYMISAARTMEHLERTIAGLSQTLDQERALNQQLHDDCVKYRKTIEEQNATIRSSTADASAAKSDSAREDA